MREREVCSRGRARLERQICRRSGMGRVLAVVLLAGALAGCGSGTPVSPDAGAFTIEAKYSYIRSHPGGELARRGQIPLPRFVRTTERQPRGVEGLDRSHNDYLRQ